MEATCNLKVNNYINVCEEPAKYNKLFFGILNIII